MLIAGDSHVLAEKVVEAWSEDAEIPPYADELVTLIERSRLA